MSTAKTSIIVQTLHGEYRVVARPAEGEYQESTRILRFRGKNDLYTSLFNDVVSFYEESDKRPVTRLPA